MKKLPLEITRSFSDYGKLKTNNKKLTNENKELKKRIKKLDDECDHHVQVISKLKEAQNIANSSIITEKNKTLATKSQIDSIKITCQENIIIHQKARIAYLESRIEEFTNENAREQ